MKFLLLIFVLISCDSIELEDTLSQLSKKSLPYDCDLSPVLKSLVKRPNLSVQGASGVCSDSIVAVTNVTYSPNSDSFSSTDTCRVTQNSGLCIYEITYDYSDPQNPTCTPVNLTPGC